MSKNVRKWGIVLLALSVVFGFRYLPAPQGLSADGMQVIGIFVGVLVLWLSVGIDWPSLVCIAALAFVPSLGMTEVLKSSFGNQTFAFLLFTFICTYCLATTSLIKRIALAFVTHPLARKGAWSMTVFFLFSVLVIGLFISPTVLFFIMLPILEEIYAIMGLKKGDPFAAMLMIGLVGCTSLSSAMTPIAHVFPVLALSVFETLTSQGISYGTYMMMAIPAGLLLFGLMLLVFRFMMRPSTASFKSLSKQDFATFETALMNTREKLIVIVFAGVVLLWILPGLVKGILPDFSAFIDQYGTAMPPLLGVILMAMIRVQDKPLLRLDEAMSKGVSWPSLIMTASTLALGAAMTHKGVGLTDFITQSILPFTQQLSMVLLLVLFVVWAAVQSNLSSHMVTAQLVTSIAVPVALSTGMLSAPAIACVVGFIASIGSAAPPSMPYVAIAGSSGWADAMTLLSYGFITMLLTIAVAALCAYPLAVLLF